MTVSMTDIFALQASATQMPQLVQRMKSNGHEDVAVALEQAHAAILSL